MTKQEEKINLKNILKRLSSFVLSAVVMTCAIATSAYAENYSAKSIKEVLKPYADALLELNQELGTGYHIISTDNMNEDEIEKMRDYFCSLSVEDYKKCIYEAHQNAISSSQRNQYSTPDISVSVQSVDMTSIIDPISPQSYTQTQKYYYDGGTQNYLYITATLFYADGHERYASINSYGYAAGTYPAYCCNYLDSSFSANQRQAYCTFWCSTLINEYTANADYFPVSVTFTAGNGDVIGSSPI